MKMREVVGAFGSFSKLSEALEELCSEGIAPDRVGAAAACAPPSSGLPQSTDDLSAATHWRSVEYAGHGEHLGVVEFHDYPFETTDLVCNQAADVHLVALKAVVQIAINESVRVSA
jgi:hypothetical protein